MTVSVRQVREAVAAALEAIEPLNVSAFPTFAIDPPHAVVKEDDIDYRQVFGTTNKAFGLSIIVFTSATDEQAAQYFLDELAEIEGARSIRQLLEEDTTFTGVDYVTVDSASPVELRISPTDPNVLYLTREWSCRVDVSNS